MKQIVKVEKSIVTNLIIFSTILLFFFSCKKEENPQSSEMVCDDRAPTYTKSVILDPKLQWVPTGIVLKRRVEVLILVDDKDAEKSVGSSEISPFDPVPIFGHRSLIGKVGIHGSPFYIGRKYGFVAGIQDENKELFLGWNDAKFSEVLTKTQEELEKEKIRVNLLVFEPPAENVVRRVSLSAPANNFWTNQQNPQFTWDSVDNSIRYLFEISDFEDFRNIVQTVEIASAGGQVGSPVSVVGGTSQQPQVTLQEGIYFWRVRAQINIGRSLNPIPVWTCWSYTFRLGVELGTPPQPPEFLSPTTEQIFKAGDKITFEFSEEDEPSFVFWRVRHVNTSCDETPRIDPNDPKSGNPTPWHIFKKKKFGGLPTEKQKLLASWESEPVIGGNHLFRIEVKDGADKMELRIRFTDFNVSVDCQSK